MKTVLKWLWFHDRNCHVVRAIDWAEMIVDNEFGQRQHVWIVNPELWLLSRFITLPEVAFRQQQYGD